MKQVRCIIAKDINTSSPRFELNKIYNVIELLEHNCIKIEGKGVYPLDGGVWRFEFINEEIIIDMSYLKKVLIKYKIK